MNQRLWIIFLALPGPLLTQSAVAAASDPVRVSAAVSDPIRIRYQHTRLADLARDLQRKSGIEISVPPELESDRLSLDIRAAAWPEAVKQVLDGYDYAAVVREDGQVRRVFLHARTTRPGTLPPVVETRAQGLAPQRAGDAVRMPASALPKRFQGLHPGSVAPIQIPFERLATLKRGESVALALGGETYRLFHDRRWPHANGETTWVGALYPGGKLYRALLTYGTDGAVAGTVSTPDGAFKIEQADGKTWAIDMEATGLRAGTLDEDQQHAASTDKATGAVPFSIATKARPSQVDLLVLYAPGVNEDHAVTRVNHLVASTQQAFEDSEVFVNLRLVHAAELADDAQKSNLAALEDLTRNRLPLDAAGLRNTYGADLVVLLRPFLSQVQGNCGVAWVGGSNGQSLSRDAGFAVISDGYDGHYYCHDYTFAHELGHLFGNVHDRPISEPGIFAFSFAWAVPGEFATIMSYWFDRAPLVGRFANPDIACTPTGTACGDAETADNARTINRTAPFVAGFMDTAVH